VIDYSHSVATFKFYIRIEPMFLQEANISVHVDMDVLSRLSPSEKLSVVYWTLEPALQE